jgi:hypothetical protein
MSLIRLKTDHVGAGVCRSCGADIDWLRTANDKPMPFDPPVRVQTVDGAPMIDTTECKPHHATCPQGPSWKRRPTT